MNFLKRKRSGLLLAALLIMACGQEQAAERDNGSQAADEALGTSRIATVNGNPVYESVFRLLSLNRLQKDADQLDPDQKEALADQLIQIQLLASAAEEKGLPKERKIAAEIELQRLQTLARSMAMRYVEENPPTETELRAAYEANLPKLAATQYKARHILVKTEVEASAIIKQLDGGADFAELAKEKSTGPTGPNGGDLGWFSADRMVKPFSEAVQSLKVGAYTEKPVETQFGWHVILLEDKKDQQAPGLDAVRQDMTNLVQQQKVQAYVESLRQKADVQIEGDQL
jgi:peptidyl-prolyl cis-trans isomerase C